MSSVQPYLGAGFEPTEFGGDAEFWETPRWAAEAIRPVLEEALARRGPLAHWHILEPSAGRGALVDFALTLPVATLNAIELDAGRARESEQRFGGRAKIWRADALALEWETVSPWHGPRLAPGNPPYSLATEFVERAIEWAGREGGVVAQLLQLDFATGVERCEAIHEKYESGFYPLKRRPKFGKNAKGKSGSGKRAYAWFVFDLAFPKREWRPIE